MEKKLSRKYQDQLKVFKGDFKEKWLALLQDLMYFTESHWDFPVIRYQAVMSKKDWRKFISHPKRKQYQSKIGLSNNFTVAFPFIIEALRDSYNYYRNLGKSSYREGLRLLIANLLDASLNARYQFELMRSVDRYYGRSREERDNGIVNPTSVSLGKLDHAIKEYCQYSGKDHKKLRERVYQISKGRLSTLSEYYVACDFDLGFRKDILAIFRILRRDQTLAFEAVKLGWEAWKIIRGIGLDLEAYLELNDAPKLSLIKKKLLSFQKNPVFVKEMLDHMKDELPDCFKLYQEQGYIENYQWFAEEARRKKYPKRLRKTERIKGMIRDCQKTVYQYFPLVAKLGPRNVFLNPLHPESTTRAFQSSTLNTKAENINVILMTPRVYHRNEYLPVLAHEATHAAQKMVIDMAEKRGVLAPGSGKKLPSAVMEDFAQLVGDLFHKARGIPKKKFAGKEFPNFRSGLATRGQVPYILIQLAIRKEFDRLYNSGFKGDLADQVIWSLKFKYDKKVKEWYSLGLKIVNDDLTAFRYFSPYDPDDGLVYMKRYLFDDEKTEKKESKKEVLTSAQAFKKRFGQDWIKKKEARIILLWLFLESGRNYRLETFGKLVLEKKLDDCFKELKIIGLDQKDI